MNFGLTWTGPEGCSGLCSTRDRGVKGASFLMLCQAIGKGAPWGRFPRTAPCVHGSRQMDISCISTEPNSVTTYHHMYSPAWKYAWCGTVVITGRFFSLFLYPYLSPLTAESLLLSPFLCPRLPSSWAASSGCPLAALCKRPAGFLPITPRVCGTLQTGRLPFGRLCGVISTVRPDAWQNKWKENQRSNSNCRVWWMR